MLDKINQRVEKFDFTSRSNRRASDFIRDTMTLDYLMNSHPNREAIFGSSSSWALNLSDESREIIKGQVRPYQIRNASEHLIDSLKSMGYENIDSDGVTYNVDF